MRLAPALIYFTVEFLIVSQSLGCSGIFAVKRNGFETLVGNSLFLRRSHHQGLISRLKVEAVQHVERCGEIRQVIHCLI